MRCPKDNYFCGWGRDGFVCLYCNASVPGKVPGEHADDAYSIIEAFVRRMLALVPVSDPMFEIGGRKWASDIVDWHNEMIVHGKIARPDAYYGVVVTTETLEHLEDPIRTVQEIARILKPAGSLILTTPMAWGYHPCPKDCWRMQPDGLEYCAEVSNMVIRNMEVFIGGTGQTLMARLEKN